MQRALRDTRATCAARGGHFTDQLHLHALMLLARHANTSLPRVAFTRGGNGRVRRCSYYSYAICITRFALLFLLLFLALQASQLSIRVLIPSPVQELGLLADYKTWPSVFRLCILDLGFNSCHLAGCKIQQLSKLASQASCALTRTSLEQGGASLDAMIRRQGCTWDARAKAKTATVPVQIFWDVPQKCGSRAPCPEPSLLTTYLIPLDRPGHKLT